MVMGTASVSRDASVGQSGQTAARDRDCAEYSATPTLFTSSHSLQPTTLERATSSSIAGWPGAAECRPTRPGNPAPTESTFFPEIHP